MGGKEIVTGSYDKTVRIWNINKGRSREVYHTRRMQRLSSVRFSWDATYVLSGSSDCNLRVWKAKASEKLGMVNPREKRKLEYMDKLKRKFAHVPEIRKIARHRHIPKWLKNKRSVVDIQRKGELKRESNRRKH